MKPGRATPCRWSFVLRYRHPNLLPEVSVHETSATAWSCAYKLAEVYPGERVTVQQDGYETEVSR